jgi:hypothetical protein
LHDRDGHHRRGRGKLLREKGSGAYNRLEKLK